MRSVSVRLADLENIKINLGYVGEKTWNKLNNVISEPVKLYTVTIKGNTKEVAEEIQAKYGGVITEE